jgi:hypothetical protein
MNVPVRDAARGKINPVATEDPVARSWVTGELPDESVAVDARRAEVCLVAGEVVDDPIPRLGIDPVDMLGECEDHGPASLSTRIG